MTLTATDVQREVVHAPEWHERRRQSLGGSDANTIMSGDQNELYELWRIKTGRSNPPDLTDNVAVVHGSWCEPLIQWLFQRQTGRLVENRGHIVEPDPLSDTPWLSGELDGETTTQEGHPAVWEAKAVGAWQKTDDVAQRYMPQLHHLMAATGHEYALLAILVGGQKLEVYEIAADPLYQADVLEAERRFWQSVTDDTPPAGVLESPEPPSVTQYRDVDMTGDNQWADAAARFSENVEAARKCDKAKSELRDMVPADAGRVYGHGVQAKRDKRGRVSIKENGDV